MNNLGLGTGRAHSDMLIVVNSVLSETISYLSRREMCGIQTILPPILRRVKVPRRLLLTYFNLPIRKLTADV